MSWRNPAAAHLLESSQVRRDKNLCLRWVSCEPRAVFARRPRRRIFGAVCPSPLRGSTPRSERTDTSTGMALMNRTQRKLFGGAFLVIATLAAGVLAFLLAVFAYAVVFGKVGDGPDSPFVTAVVGSFAVAFV